MESGNFVWFGDSLTEAEELKGRHSDLAIVDFHELFEEVKDL